MCPAQQFRAGSHALRIERALIAILEPLPERVGRGAVQDRIAIRFGPGVQPCVEAFRRLPHICHGNVLGQVSVDIMHYLLLRRVKRGFEIGDLSDGVDACVGASGAVHLDILPGHAGEDRLQLSLDGAVVLLRSRSAELLPAEVARAVVLHGHPVIIYGIHSLLLRTEPE